MKTLSKPQNPIGRAAAIQVVLGSQFCEEPIGRANTFRKSLEHDDQHVIFATSWQTDVISKIEVPTKVQGSVE